MARVTPSGLTRPVAIARRRRSGHGFGYGRCMVGLDRGQIDRDRHREHRSRRCTSLSCHFLVFPIAPLPLPSGVPPCPATRELIPRAGAPIRGPAATRRGSAAGSGSLRTGITSAGRCTSSGCALGEPVIRGIGVDIGAIRALHYKTPLCLTCRPASAWRPPWSRLASGRVTGLTSRLAGRSLIGRLPSAEAIAGHTQTNGF